MIKPVPSTVTLPNSRDDDEMFLEDADDVSVSDLVHLKSSPKSPGFNLSSHDALPNYHIPKLTSLSDAGKDKLYRKHAHFVFKKKNHSNEGPHGDFAALEPGHLPSFFNNSTWKLHYSNSSTSSNGSHRRSKRQSPDTVWPEVLLVVDYDSYLLHGGNSRDVKRYFISFWNGVDLRYKLLSHPRIRVSLAGMIVAKVMYLLLCCLDEEVSLFFLYLYPPLLAHHFTVNCLLTLSSLFSFLFLFSFFFSYFFLLLQLKISFFRTEMQLLTWSVTD